jgi:hypothetical protein
VTWFFGEAPIRYSSAWRDMFDELKPPGTKEIFVRVKMDDDTAALVRQGGQLLFLSPDARLGRRHSGLRRARGRGQRRGADPHFPITSLGRQRWHMLPTSSACLAG